MVVVNDGVIQGTQRSVCALEHVQVVHVLGVIDQLLQQGSVLSENGTVTSLVKGSTKRLDRDSIGNGVVCGSSPQATVPLNVRLPNDLFARAEVAAVSGVSVARGFENRIEIDNGNIGVGLGLLGLRHHTLRLGRRLLSLGLGFVFRRSLGLALSATSSGLGRCFGTTRTS